MDYQEYFYKLTIFHSRLQTDYGLLIKAATCIAFGAVCGWIMALLAWILYKITIYLDAVPVVKYNYLDDDLDLESETGKLTQEKRKQRKKKHNPLA
ncbi:uncharacterized protein LOC132791060 [Drosophila nasuta]|uniref:Uncharacterized protein LOC117564242 n=1 Tax=Drosophila albomicans TaxID=7291 RepID=A0A6P8WLR5_DROAB|nr:uncharacterized protein LOC117564242 [Drosophila albomicans]XP_060655832.1 uncharacterized protein LOC132791060 [Drosophila nasuta]